MITSDLEIFSFATLSRSNDFKVSQPQDDLWDFEDFITPPGSKERGSLEVFTVARLQTLTTSKT